MSTNNNDLGKEVKTQEQDCGTSCGCGSNVNGYWQDVEDKTAVEAVAQEFPEGEFDSFSVKKDRRSFLKIMGFSVSALPLAGCVKIPVRKAIPYLHKNPSQIPGVANYFATNFEGNPVLIKTREGRPIKTEGNKLSSVTAGGTNARGQASVLELYDSNRLRSAQVEGKDVEWSELDKLLKAAVSGEKQMNKKMVLVSKSMTSPSELKLISELSAKMGIEHIAYSPVETSAISEANMQSFGVFAPSSYELEDADVIVSFGADFLGTFGNDIKQSNQYAKRRKPGNPKGMSKHIQVESYMSLTGSNADNRFTRSEESKRNVLLAVYAQVTGDASSAPSLGEEDKKLAAFIVKNLKSAKNSLVLAGDNNVDTQMLVNAINMKLGNFGKTVRVLETDSVYANNEKFEQFVSDMAAGKVGAAMFLGVNPAHSYSKAETFKSALSKVGVRVSFSSSLDETGKLCNFLAPNNHAYESWSDTLVDGKELSFTQPVIQPLFGSRMAMETLMNLAGVEGSFHDYMMTNWENSIFPKAGTGSNFKNFWNKALHDGVIAAAFLAKEANYRNVSAASSAKALKSIKSAEGVQVVTYQKFAIGDGEMINNPLLQEMPDPITKATWDNYIMVSPADAKEQGIKSGNVLKLEANGHTVTLPAVVQPGVARNTVAVAVGYGRSVSGKVGTGLGGNAYPFSVGQVFGKYTKTAANRPLALSQTHQSMEGRDIVRETTEEAFNKDNSAGNKPKMHLAKIYPENEYLGKSKHQWAMAIDLNTCTGCSTCVVACNTENNVPVVGRTEVHRRRDMHWLRIDRYYAGDDQQPETVHMPMLCQHCEDAPCENVCPVLATVHSSDGMNQMIYNRCVGTRYCANNCPYKVRRFNWFNYDHSDEYARMALNPDVSVRSRGVMEKCSFCVQRIQEGKLTAKRERRELRADDIVPACAQSCPTEGIVFGDMNDKNSPISKMLEDQRTYTVLEELNTRPRVNYMVKVRNKTKEEA